MPGDGACKEFDVNGRRYRAQRDGAFHVENPAHVKIMRKTGECFIPKTRMAGKGYRCPQCGHLAVFAHDCGRCGHADLILEEA